MSAGEELPPTVARLVADTADFVRQFSDTARSVRDMAAPSLEAAEATQRLDGKMRDAALAAGEEARLAGEARDGLGEVAIASGGAAEALGHLRDEALEASEAEKKLRDSSAEAAGQLDLLGLSGVSSLGPLASLAGIIGALVVAAAAVAPAAVAAGLGLGAFGAVAIPTLKSVFGALGDTKAQLAALPAPIRTAVTEVRNLERQFDGLAKAFQPRVIGLFGQALGIVSGLLPRLIPLMQAGSQAAGLFLNALNKGVSSPGFARFLQLMTSMVVPATQAIIRLAGVLTGILGQALTQLAPMSVPFINVISTLLSALGGPVVAVLKVVISLFLGLAGAIEPLLPGLSKIATELVGDIGSSFQSFIPVLQQVVQLIGGSLLQVLQDLLPVLANTFTQNSPFMFALQLLPGLLRAVLPAITALTSILSHPLFAQLAVDILSALAAGKAIIGVLGLVSKAFGLLGLAFEATPVGWIITAIAAIAFGLYELWTHSSSFRDFWEDAWKGIRMAASDAWQVIDGKVVKPMMAGIDALVGFVEAHWRVLAIILGGLLLGPVAALAIFLAEHWKTIAAGAVKAARAIAAPFESMWKALVAWWSSYGGEITEIWNALWAVASAVVITTARLILVAVRALAGGIAAVWDLVAGITRGAWDVISAVVRGVIGVIVAVVRAQLMALSDIFRVAWASAVLVTRVAWTAIAAVVKVAWAIVTAVVKAGWDILIGVFDVMLDLLTGHWSRAWKDVQRTFGQVWNAIRTAAGQAWNAVIAGLEGLLGAVRSYVGSVLAVVERIPGQVVSALSGLVGALYNLGRNIIEGLLSGIKSAAGGVLSFVGGLGHDISGAFAAAIHALSPSRVFMEHGVNIVRGIILGVQAQAPQLLASIADVARSASSAARIAVAATSPAGGLPALAGGGVPPGVLSAGTGGGGCVIQLHATFNGLMDGQKVFTSQQAFTYRYNIRNSGRVTGVLKPA